MKTCKLLIALVAILGVVSCGKFPLVDSIWMVYIRFINNTDHHIAITQLSTIDYNDLEILPGGSVDKLRHEEWYSGFITNLSDEEREEGLLHAIPTTLTVVWDGEYSITYDRNNHSDKLLVPERYTYLKSVSTNGCFYYGYTFTEEDYEYAKANGVKIEPIVE